MPKPTSRDHRLYCPRQSGAGRSFVRKLREYCRRLMAFPEAARLRPELGEGVHLSVSGNYVILYVVHPDLLEIRRVVHGARNLADIDQGSSRSSSLSVARASAV